MSQSKNKTQPTNSDVEDFIASVKDDQKRKDSMQILEMMKRVTGEEAVMWGTSIVGFGSYHYKYESGREGDFMMVGFSPRKQYIAVYIMPDFSNFTDQLERLGKHKTSLYINKLADVDKDVLEELIKESYDQMKKEYH